LDFKAISLSGFLTLKRLGNYIKNKKLALKSEALHDLSFNAIFIAFVKINRSFPILEIAFKLSFEIFMTPITKKSHAIHKV